MGSYCFELPHIGLGVKCAGHERVSGAACVRGNQILGLFGLTTWQNDTRWVYTSRMTFRRDIKRGRILVWGVSARRDGRLQAQRRAGKGLADPF